MSLQPIERAAGDVHQNEAQHTGAPACVHLNRSNSTVRAWPDRFLVSRGSSGEKSALPASLNSTDIDIIGRLLSGCIAAALPGIHSVQEQPHEEPPVAKELKLRDHIFNQCANYHAMRFTRSTVERARVRFEAIGDTTSAQFCSHVKKEEAGHDKLALMDLKALGLPASELVERFAPRQPLRVVQLLIDYSREEVPYGIFGYGYAVERLCLVTTEAAVSAVRNLAPSGVEIARCMEVHSSAGVEVEHLRHLVKFVAELNVEAKQQICDAVFHTVSTIQDNQTDQEDRQLLDSILDEWQWKPFVGVER